MSGDGKRSAGRRPQATAPILDPTYLAASCQPLGASATWGYFLPRDEAAGTRKDDPEPILLAAHVFGQAGLAPSRCRLHAAEAGGLDRHVGPGGGDVETLLDDDGFRVLAEPHQAFVKSVQAPDVFRMLAGARQHAVEAKIGAVDRLRFLHAALFQQECSQRMVGPGRSRRRFFFRPFDLQLKSRCWRASLACSAPEGSRQTSLSLFAATIRSNAGKRIKDRTVRNR